MAAFRPAQCACMQMRFDVCTKADFGDADVCHQAQFCLGFQRQHALREVQVLRMDVCARQHKASVRVCTSAVHI